MILGNYIKCETRHVRRRAGVDLEDCTEPRYLGHEDVCVQAVCLSASRVDRVWQIPRRELPEKPLWTDLGSEGHEHTLE